MSQRAVTGTAGYSLDLNHLGFTHGIMQRVQENINLSWTQKQQRMKAAINEANCHILEINLLMGLFDFIRGSYFYQLSLSFMWLKCI